MNILIYLLVFMPMAAAAVSYLVGHKSKTGRDLFVVFTVAAEFALSLALLVLGSAEEEILVSLPGI